MGVIKEVEGFEFSRFIDNLSLFLLKLRSEKAVSDNEIRLYTLFIDGLAYSRSGSPELWEFLESQLENAFVKAHEKKIST
jgi:hypothetical protein